MSPPSQNRHALTEQERREYDRDGFFVREAVFDENELAALREAAEIVAASAKADSENHLEYRIDGNRYVNTASQTIQYEHDESASTVRVIEPFHHRHPLFEELIDDPRLVEPMKGVIGTEQVALWTDKINLKRPREGSGFRWHQDSPYWTHACEHVDLLPNVMITLDDASEENGCFRVVRGSHRKGCLPGIDDDTKLGPLFTDPKCFDETMQVPAIVSAGSLVFFSPHSVHGSQPNHSDLPRRAMVLTYQPGGHAMFKLNGTRNAG